MWIRGPFLRAVVAQARAPAGNRNHGVSQRGLGVQEQRMSLPGVPWGGPQ